MQQRRPPIERIGDICYTGSGPGQVEIDQRHWPARLEYHVPRAVILVRYELRLNEQGFNPRRWRPRKCPEQRTWRRIPSFGRVMQAPDKPGQIRQLMITGRPFGHGFNWHLTGDVGKDFAAVRVITEG
jgi:hypothetical protein